MRTPEALESLVEHGIVEEVVRPLMSGKEAQVYLVIAEGHECVAKIYKDAQERSFKNKADYTEGRQVRNTRDQRAMSKRTANGRSRDEAAWKSTEVDMIYQLTEAGVRVPEPYWFVDGVLVMELVRDSDGSPAKRLGELQFSREDAMLIFEVLLADVVRMLHAGVVHGDLSEFNVLMGADGPVIIDFPQAVNAAGNQNARKILMRDVDNLHRFVLRFDREWASPPYAEEMWALYERGELKADTTLTGKFARSTARVRTEGVMDLIDSARSDEQFRRRNMGIPAHKRRGAAPLPRNPPQQQRTDAPAPRRDDSHQPHRDERPHQRNDNRPQERISAPRRDNREGPSGDHGSQRDDHRNAPHSENRSLTRGENRGTARGDNRGTSRVDNRDATRDNHRVPPRSDQRGTPRGDNRGPQSDNRSPLRGEQRGTPRGDNRGPQSDNRGPLRGDNRALPRPDDRGSRNDNRSFGSRDNRNRGPAPSNNGRGPRR
ncbi:MAG: hypothetical protein H7Z43_10450 [Clostridia bacterium]|nr:hypothetical protein [Deltaproteobacteria bacterium]